MSAIGYESGSPTVSARLRAVLRGASDTRVRATWRVVLAMPLLWLLTGGVLTGNLQAAVGWIPSGGTPAAGLAQSLLHGGFFLVALAAWARYLDRRPLSEYGVSASGRWLRDLLVGFGAVVLGFGAWFALGALLGQTTVEASMSYPGGSLPLGLAILLVALVLHAAVQQVVFFRVILENAAEGLHGRGAAPSTAVVGAALVAIPFFVAIHGVTTGLRLLDLAVAGGIFALLYVHTGELALGIGVHLGALYGGSVLFAPAARAAGGPVAFEVSGSLPGLLGVVDQYGFPKLVVAYLLLTGWLAWRRGELPVETAIARRADSGASGPTG